MTTDVVFAYLVVVRLSAQDEPLPERVARDMPIVIDVLRSLCTEGEAPHLAFTSKDGGTLGAGVLTTHRSETVESRIYKGTEASPIRLRDQVYVMEIGARHAVRNNDRFASWLREINSLYG